MELLHYYSIDSYFVVSCLHSPFFPLLLLLCFNSKQNKEYTYLYFFYFFYIFGLFIGGGLY
ncbi:hypothetical protein GLOIN_2v1630220 [Rhizophagus irregularis DAOM 181602=DAOM 197198]|uniref:Uncharacterized protein n=1 Tax=Rhizophagus irregularis (strain DAOM 181602 / DAOM 197198 / MUCL 43194) TaxID=747089 RepID=A0A2P4PUX0_RHIID|nr:hypothetical protein GLOIN_2v1630220 [Rhizophagus irregularis DAOM 181602=DAOM 197198]POG69166.1 hypothetical protein GLOIN_2v1630220 [Rhizophagus irregularis DAOM 181602=DAOM 197198]|eukprot:XP_025176032.1 hypothetical protein GLOIN_2v1630220 [Rhizophagus irregularis DAOM 181602=DAOM 197198]